MTSQVDIYNMALGAIGAEGRLSDVAENRKEAEVCNLFYPLAKRKSFCMAYWASLRTTKRLALVAERGEEWADGGPNPRWRYSYALPADCIRPRYLQNYGYFELERSAGYLTLHTNHESPILTYTQNVDDPKAWEIELLALVAAVLASDIAMPIAKKSAIRNDAISLARDAYLVAAAATANVQHPMIYDVTPPELLARGDGVGSGMELRFYYPVEGVSFGPYGKA